MLKIKQHTDKKLLKKLTKGDAKAFDQLYYRYAERVSGFAFTFFKRQDLAEEAVQEVFVRIWERRKELDPEKSFKSYLFQSVKFYMYNFLRDKRPGCSLSEVPEELWVGVRNAHDELAAKELEEAAFAMIEKLPQVQKEVFKQNRLEGKSALEIAERMNLSKRTIEHHLYLATKTLKLELLQHPLLLLAYSIFIST